MDIKTRNILNSNRELIIKDLHGDVVDTLLHEGVLNLEEYEKINYLNHQEERNILLLDILSTKNSFLDVFIASLRDWYGWIADRLVEEPTEEKYNWKDILSYVPSVPERNVSRTDLLNEVRSALKQLNRSHYVVLHGMSGCGKSSLAAEALHHEISEQFQGKVHWLSCGQDTKNDENKILALLMELNERICDEELVSDVKTANVNTLKVKLSKRFNNSDFKEGLIVLDDVDSAQVIDALNIGCKTLVTTNDINVMTNQASRYHEIKVKEGFTEEESLTQLALSVNVNVQDLPVYARQIHLHSKGHPLIMSLIGAQLSAHQEEARVNAESWKPYLDVLVSREYGELPRRSLGGDEQFLPKTIELCINNLSSELQEKYQDFALFVEDVNIKTEVLEVLWDLPKYKVQQIMFEFSTKSLIVRKFNPLQECYVYGIHDILLYFLRTRMEKEAIKELHRKLIRRYQEVCEENVDKLPKHDNYFFYYVGYHISKAELYHLFPKWYFDLYFIEAKLKVAGAGDLLLDYKRYNSHFTEDKVETISVTKKLADFVRFVEASGMEVRRTHNTDIVQFALQEPHDSEVYKIAMRLVQSRPDSTYLRFPLGPSKSRTAPHTIQTKYKVTSACFSTDSNNIIVGFQSGFIQIMNQKGYVTRVYEGHTQTVTRLAIATNKGIFLSVSGSCVKIWKLPDLDSSISSGNGDRTPSPSQRQTDFTDIFNNKSTDKQMSWLTVNHKTDVDWASFSTDGLKMASCCSTSGTVLVFEMSNRNCLLSRVSVKGTSCTFSHNNELIVIGTENSVIYIHNLVTNTQVKRLLMSYSLLALFSLPENNMQMKFVALTKATLSVWELDESHLKIQPDEQNSIRCLRDYNKGEHEVYVCCAAAPDGSIVAVATSSGKILICDLSDGSVVREMNDSSGTIKYLAIDESKDHLLLACYDDETIKIWTLGEVHLGKPATMKTNFVVAWSDDHTPILAAPTYKSCVKKIFGSKSEDLHIPVNSEINICGISDCGKYIAISTTCGEVYLHFDDNKLQMPRIMTVQKCVTKLKIEIIEDTVFVVVGLDRLCRVWKCSEEIMLHLSKSETLDIALSDRLIDIFILKGSTEFMTVSQNGSIKKWCMNSGKLLSIVCQTRFDVSVCDSAFNRDNRIVTLDSRRQIINIYTLEDVTKENQIKLDSIPNCCNFSFNGNNLAIGFKDGSIQVLNTDMPATTLKEITALDEPIESVCVNDQGLVCGATKSVVVLQSASGGIGQAKLRVQRLVMSPNNSTVITVDTDGHMHLIEDYRNTAPCALGRPSRPATNSLTLKLKTSSLAEKA